MSRDVRYLSAKDVAERYGRPLKWVYKCKDLPRRKIGKYLTYREDELEKFEKRRNSASRGFIIRRDAKVDLRQNARKRLKFDCL